MATRRGIKELERMQESADMEEGVLIIARVDKLPSSHSNSMVSTTKQYLKDLAWDGTEGMPLFEKTAKLLMANGFGRPRDAFPEVYRDLLGEQDQLLEENKDAFDAVEAREEERRAWVVGKLYEEADPEFQAPGISEQGFDHLAQQQEAADQRMGGIVQRLAKRAMDKVVDTMVAFDNSIDAVAAKSKSMWSSVTDAIKSKKTKLAALAATAIVAAGLTGNPAQAADIPRVETPTTHAEMMQSMHEGRMEQMEQDIQEELQAGMHEARADFMEEQLKQAAKDKFSSHLQSLKAEAVAEFSEGLDQAIEQAEKDFDYSYNILHNPAFQDAALSNPDVQDALMENESVKNVVRYSPATQNLMDDMQYDDGIMEKLLEDEEIKRRVTELNSYKRMMSSKMGVDTKSLDDNVLMSRTIDMPGVKDMVLQDGLVKLDMMLDEQIQDRVLREPAVRKMAFSVPETQDRVLGISGIDRVLDTPDMERRVMQDFGRDMSLNLPEEVKAPDIVHMPEESQVPRLNITQAELDQLASSPSAKAPELNLPDQAERELVNLQPPKEHKLNLPEQEERELVHLQPPTERHFNADFQKRLEADTITYDKLSELMFDPNVYTNVHFTPPPTSNMDAEIDAHSIKVLVERQGVEFGQFLGQIEKNAEDEVVSTIRRLVESAGIEWNTSGYDKQKDPNHFVLKDHEVDSDPVEYKEYPGIVRG